MRAFVKTLDGRVPIARESSTLVAALLVAETTFRLGSFTLELVATLATWYALSFAAERIGRAVAAGRGGRS